MIHRGPSSIVSTYQDGVFYTSIGWGGGGQINQTDIKLILLKLELVIFDNF